MNKIYLFLTYYGNFPNYFQLYLDSIGINKDILVLFIITNNDLNKYNIPINVNIINLTLNSVKQRASLFLLNEYNVDIFPEDLILKPYKLCDYKCIYHILFNDIIIKYGIDSNDYIGYCDCDMIFGKCSNFIDLNNNYYIIGYHGHFTAFKNIDEIKLLYKNIPNFEILLIDNNHQCTDEKHFRHELFSLIHNKQYNCYNMWQVFCDIIPWQFKNNWKYLERPLTMDEKKLLVMSMKEDKIINHLSFNKNFEKLMVYFDNGEEMETIYVHLQKRDMKLDFSQYNDIFYILKDSFETEIKN